MTIALGPPQRTNAITLPDLAWSEWGPQGGVPVLERLIARR